MSTETERRVENLLSNKMKIEGNDGAGPSNFPRIIPSLNASTIDGNETASGFDNIDFSAKLRDLQNSRKVCQCESLNLNSIREMLFVENLGFKGLHLTGSDRYNEAQIHKTEQERAENRIM